MKAEQNKKDDSLYTNESIISINPREFTRLRPSTYLGSNEYSTQLVCEVFSNALDEHIIGHGKEIILKIDTKNNIYTVIDEGQGFPINVLREDNETVLQASFDVINTSGKYDENGIYQGSVVGLNGIGSKLTNFLSTKLTVKSYDGKSSETCNFKDGIFESRKVEASTHAPGTEVSWQPDPQFFQNKEVNLAEIKKLFEETAALCRELTIKLFIDQTEIIYHTKNGIQDLLDKKVSGKESISNRFLVTKIVDHNLLDLALTYTSEFSETIIAYVNYGLTSSGTHIATLKAGMTRQINRYATDSGLLKKNDSLLTQAELSEGAYIVFNIKANGVKYDSQTKTRVVDLDKSLINEVVNNDFYDWLVNNPKDAKVIIDKALLARKAKEAAQKAKDGIRNAVSRGKKFISLPTKLIDAYSKNRAECELFITEGDSAANGLIAKRNGKTQAIFPIRGKILSCRKATMDKVYANQEISNIVKALGLDINSSNGKLIYDSKKLRYHKIILAADADADGFDIRLLLINAFWWLCQELVTNGHICVALPPLFRITTSKNQYVYLKDAAALSDYKEKHKKETFNISRNKGLGEMDSAELAYCLLNNSTRNVQALQVINEEQTEDLLETFMGNSVGIRRDFLLQHAEEVQVDVE